MALKPELAKEAAMNLELSNEKLKLASLEESEIIVDLHIHSRFSRATSKNLDIPNLVKYARIKGLDLLGTGDISHEKWLAEIRENLKEKNKTGVYVYSDEKGEFPFILSGEISLVFTSGGKGRRVHLVYLAPNLEVNEKINNYLDTKGRRDYDGRPIFNISCEEFVGEMMKLSDKIEVIPAHCMTPWFGVFGSESGFDSLEEAFGSQTENIHAVESGMSADPEMLWGLGFLKNKAIVSFSDSHSFWPWRIGRESTVFILNQGEEPTYDLIISQIRNRSFKSTIETDPAYGKYHWDGHRACNFSCPPARTKEVGGICPVCKRKLVIGVENRVEKLANFQGMPADAKMFYKILPLHELIAFYLGTSLSSKRVQKLYDSLIKKYGNEFNVLLKVDKNIIFSDLAKENHEELARLIIDNRIANIKVQPGFDGEYGKLVLKKKQESLFN